MKRVLLLAAVAVAVSGLVWMTGRMERERQYRQLLTAGEEALAAGTPYRALEQFSGALALRPDSVVAYYRRGEAYRALRQYDGAVSDWTTASRLAPDMPEPLVALGELHDLRNDPLLAAERYADAAVLLRNEDPALLYALALARYRAGTPATAIAPLQEALARNDTLAEGHYLLGLILRDVGRPNQAVLSLERAVALRPRLIGAREELASVYRTLGRAADELLQLQALADLDPQPDRRIAIALAQGAQGSLDTALASLTDLAGAAPGDSRIHLAIGRLHLMRAERTGSTEAARQARDALEIALGGTARRSEGLALLGRAEYLSGELASAERILREAVATTPADPRAFAFLADVAERLAHPLVARDALINLDLLEANTALPDRRADRARRIGRLSQAGGDPATAVRYFGRALDGGPADAGTLAAYAGALWNLDRAPEARATIARASALDPAHPLVARWRRTIRD